MIGEKIGEEKGKITGRRVLRKSELQVAVEATQQGAGEILGVKYTSMGTYSSVMRDSGTLLGEGQGVIMTQDGESATWVGQGVGLFRGKGMIGFRGAIYFGSASKKLEPLNSVAVVFEYEADGEGNYTSKYWEWK
jgi:hypothetical protein